jgi:hypothetical protein
VDAQAVITSSVRVAETEDCLYQDAQGKAMRSFQWISSHVTNIIKKYSICKFEAWTICEFLELQLHIFIGVPVL